MQSVSIADIKNNNITEFDKDEKLTLYCYDNCTNEYTWEECEEIYGDNLISVISGEYDQDNYGFVESVYLDRFQNTYEQNFGDGWDEQYIDVVEVGQFPLGVSPFGVYDIIGNAPEVVNHNNLLWLIGPTAYSSQISSFCGNDGSMFNESSSYNSVGEVLSNYQGTNFNLYGLRLARTTQ